MKTDMENRQPLGAGTAKPPRRVYIDLVRILAILMVIFIHTNNKGATLFLEKRGSPFFGFYLFSDVFVRMAVPLFFMTSGAVLLGKEESYGTLLKKRFARFAVVLVVASLVVYCYRCFRASALTFSVSDFLRRLYSGDISVPYWYLYRYLAYILMLPLLRKLAAGMGDREFRWMFWMFALIRSLTYVDFLLWKGALSHESHFAFMINMDYVFYPLMGWHIASKQREGKLNGRTALALVAGSAAAIGICCFMVCYKCNVLEKWDKDTSDSFHNILAFVPTVQTFYLCGLWEQRRKPRPRLDGAITLVGGLTFGIYLLEYMCRRETLVVYNTLEPILKSYLASWVWVFSVFALAGVITFMLKKVPGVKRYL